MNDSTQVKDGVRSYFESGAAVNRWESLYSGTKDFFSYAMMARREAVVAVLRRLSPASGPNVADVGCGAGLISKDLLELGYDVTGVDMSEEMLATAAKVPGLKLQQGDVEHLPFDTASLDKVACLGVITYLPDETRALAELRRILRPDGTMVLAVRNSWEMGQRWDLPRALQRALRRLFGRPGTSAAKSYFHRTFVPPALVRGVTAAGFTVEEVIGRGFDVPTLLGRRWLPLRASVRFSRWMERIAGRRPLRFLNQHGLVLILVARAR